MATSSYNRVDRAMNPVARQGAMDASAMWDASTVQRIQSVNASKPSAYKGAHVSDNFAIAAHEVVFAVRDSHTLNGYLGGVDPTLRVLSAINGMGSNATSQYGQTDPEMVRQAVRARLRVIGVATGKVDAARGQHESGVNVAVAGLITLKQSKSASRSVQPGDIVVADVPLYTDAPSGANGGGAGKYQLQPRALDPRAPAVALQTHVRNLIEDPRQWRDAMGPRYRSTNAWMSASKNVIDSYTSGALLMIGSLVDAGILEPGAKLTQALRSVYPGPGANTSQGQQITVVLADLFGQIASDDARKRLSSAERVAWARARHNATRAVFVNPRNVLDQFGVLDTSGGGAPHRVDASRFPRTGEIRDTAYGQMLRVQLDHFARASGGLAHAVFDEQKCVLGKATTGATRDGSNNFHLALGIMR